MYPSHYLSQYHIDVKVVNIGVKLLGWSIDPKGIKNKEILKYLQPTNIKNIKNKIKL